MTVTARRIDCENNYLGETPLNVTAVAILNRIRVQEAMRPAKRAAAYQKTTKMVGMMTMVKRGDPLWGKERSVPKSYQRKRTTLIAMRTMRNRARSLVAVRKPATLTRFWPSEQRRKRRRARRTTTTNNYDAG